MTIEERIKGMSEFKKNIKTMNETELKDLSEKLLKEAKELDEKVSKKEFSLVKKGQKECFDNIKFFLNTQKVKWNYALGMITIYEFFDKEQKAISFAVLDTVLRTLGSLDFEGYDQWKRVVNINTYFTPFAEEYREITDSIYDIAEKNAIIDKTLELFNKQKEQPTDEVQNLEKD